MRGLRPAPVPAGTRDSAQGRRGDHTSSATRSPRDESRRRDRSPPRRHPSVASLRSASRRNSREPRPYWRRAAPRAAAVAEAFGATVGAAAPATINLRLSAEQAASGAVRRPGRSHRAPPATSRRATVFRSLALASYARRRDMRPDSTSYYSICYLYYRRRKLIALL